MRTKIRTLGLICLLMMGCAQSAKKKTQINSWQSLFTEPCEIVYVTMKDGQIFRFSSGEVRRTSLTAERLKRELKNAEKPYKIKDISIVIHNHRTKRRFLPGDWQFYRDLKRRGFNGLFLLYCHRTSKTYDIEDKNK